MSDLIQTSVVDIPDEWGVGDRSEPLNISDYGSVRILRKEGLLRSCRLIDADYEMRTNDYAVVFVGGASTTITLPKAAVGKEVVIKHAGGGPGVTIDGGGKTIDNLSTKTLSATYNCVVLLYNGDEWSIISEI